MASKDVDAFPSVIIADICSYWNSVSKVMDVTRAEMFPNLSSLAKACLTISHGNAVTERGFSVNTALWSLCPVFCLGTYTVYCEYTINRTTVGDSELAIVYCV